MIKFLSFLDNRKLEDRQFTQPRKTNPFHQKHQLYQRREEKTILLLKVIPSLVSFELQELILP